MKLIKKKELVVFNEMPFNISEVKDKQRPGTDVIRTKINIWKTHGVP